LQPSRVVSFLLFFLLVNFLFPNFFYSGLQARKKKLSLQHQNELHAQKNETARLKEELIQLGL
jgi:hypothetical protein